jgi:predicted nucleotide-binding protein
VLTYAQEEATRLNHNYIGTEHLLLGLIREEEGLAAKVLRDLGVEQARVRQVVEDIVGRGQAAPGTRLSLTPRTKRVIELAVDEAQKRGHHYIGTEHLLFALVREGDGIAVNVLKSLNVNVDQVRVQTLRVLESAPSLKIEPANNNVLIVHGGDDVSKEAVTRFIEQLGLSSTMLRDQPNAGGTIIERFDYSSVGFVIVLLFPDYLDTARDKPDEFKPRARQQVAFELGYFVGKLGPERVCALHKQDIEIPFDDQALTYVPMDSAGRWRVALAEAMKRAGMQVDPNKVL